MIEQWLTNDVIAQCKGASITAHNENLFDANVKPYADQAVKGWVYYQGENNCGVTLNLTASRLRFHSSGRTLTFCCCL